MKSGTKKIIAVSAVVLLLAASRLLKHPYNFTPITAMSIFAGCYLRKNWGLVFPLGGMLVSDFFIGFYDWKLMAAVYAGIAISFYIGWYLRKKITWNRVIFAALISSLLFFVVSNFAVWLFYQWYPHTLAGLNQCFILALPFFKNSLAGDLIYTGAIFAAYEFSFRKIKQRALPKAA
ncbi:MAG: hypothetical protein UX02_C0003G0058 [Candidatus Moranbacteria bacterium GW2011_GWC1_45_18]|nr:MAG: hypothetical protein UT79_C0004G0058 [Candidatus Moranbacteria bacterium GW2011_GWC2_40_12]KKT33670.1 MAG: hypothetical protein UW19_C0007G0061 [Candidatus Moranbacteria bacterium GW2011_GWF2_44_10]KKT71585.1 MAG: hypothetical protein UW66_C0027G0007 [Candidatus Moranbacteria bacterium GW2011_GWF1_44_4]KKT99515.1 MAG: hypothetical protein UX02_C0003G0058 [Candidatus Moranbacteria bacterium GW2011_GWC1_45_18]OGI22416.1 MAG: hypothetical protein A2194_01220 [Candidatus Moranbacteria bacte